MPKHRGGGTLAKGALIAAPAAVFTWWRLRTRRRRVA